MSQRVANNQVRIPVGARNAPVQAAAETKTKRRPLEVQLHASIQSTVKIDGNVESTVAEELIEQNRHCINTSNQPTNWTTYQVG
jgi:hypothetical protein